MALTKVFSGIIGTLNPDLPHCALNPDLPMVKSLYEKGFVELFLYIRNSTPTLQIGCIFTGFPQSHNTVYLPCCSLNLFAIPAILVQKKADEGAFLTNADQEFANRVPFFLVAIPDLSDFVH